MNACRYDVPIVLDDTNRSHSLAILSVPRGSRVLDVGTSTGRVAQALRQRGCEVWGIEVDEEAAREAREHCTEVLVADIEHMTIADAFPNEHFDVILFLDVLEHLREPQDVVRRFVPLLGKGGVLIVSIPNVTHASVTLSSLRGRFHYTETGLLDRTHLRFFDRQSAEGLLTGAGLAITERFRVIAEPDETELAIDLDTFPPEVISEALRNPDARTYQFVLVAGRAEGGEPQPAGLNEQLQTELDQRRQEIRAIRRHVERLDAEIAELATMHIASQGHILALEEAVSARDQTVESLRMRLQSRRYRALDFVTDPLVIVRRRRNR